MYVYVMYASIHSFVHALYSRTSAEDMRNTILIQFDPNPAACGTSNVEADASGVQNDTPNIQAG